MDSLVDLGSRAHHSHSLGATTVGVDALLVVSLRRKPRENERISPHYLSLPFSFLPHIEDSYPLLFFCITDLRFPCILKVKPKDKSSKRPNEQMSEKPAILRDTQDNTDEALMTRYQAGDMDAFDQLYLRYEKKLYNYLLKTVRDASLAADLFQEVFLKLHRFRDQYDPRQSFAPWFFTIAANTMKNAFRAQRGAHEEILTEEIQDEKQSTVSGPDRHVEAEELGGAIEKALSELPQNQREVILLSKMEGFSYGEIAQVLGMTSNAVKQMAHRGLIALRKKLTEWTTP
jgi:RNA polymerase sigma factor (sigma-70 family)